MKQLIYNLSQNYNFKNFIIHDITSKISQKKVFIRNGISLCSMLTKFKL